MTKGSISIEAYCRNVFDYIKDGGGAAPTPDHKMAIDSEDVQNVIVKYADLSTEDLSLYVFAFYILSTGFPPEKLLDEVKDSFIIGEKEFIKALSQALPANTSTSEVAPFPTAFKALRDATQNMNKSIRADEKKLIAFYEFMYFFSLGKALVFQSQGESDRVEIATEVWRFFFYVPGEPTASYTRYIPFQAVNEWLAFVQTDRFSTVSFDLWRMLYRFTKLADYDTYDPEDSWPLMLDDFVEWFNEKKKIESDKKDGKGITASTK